MSRRELSSFRWNGIEWVAAQLQPESEGWNNVSREKSKTVPVVGETIRVATWNILADCFPWFIEMVISSPERFDWLCDNIALMNPTIIGLNEVTVTALQRLLECPFIRDNYFTTENGDMDHHENGLLAPHGCVILSKLPLLEVFAISVPGGGREAVVGKIQLGTDLESCAYFCSHHTTAYQTPKNAQLRASQIREIVNVLRPLSLPFVIMGDLNLHYESEDAVVIDNDLIDAWAQTHFSGIDPFNDEDPGYTFDAVKNTLIPRYIPGEQRQMRLDRILFSHGFPAFATRPCAMWADTPVKSDNYLFPSDHFGLFVDIFPSQSLQVRETESRMMYMGEADPSAQEVLCRNAQKNIERQAYRLGILQRTVALIYHTFWLGAIAVGLR